MKFATGILGLAILLFVGCQSEPKAVPDSVAASPPPSPSTLPMQPLSLQDMRAFKAVGENWHIAGNVSSDYQVEQDLQIHPGTGILVNQVNDNKAKDLYTNWEHGDIELKLEFMLPKGSNSGIYLQGRYEVQILDSWLKETPGYGDLGGIYQRWKEEAPEGQQGYEGHPPALNASKAPGLWQTFYIKFKAPRFDASGQKTANAVFEKVVLNGHTIHENVELSGPTRGPVVDDEVPTAPLRIQGDHGKVAFRNIQYKRSFLESVRLQSMSYKYYEIPSLAGLPDFSTLTPVKEGQVDSFVLDKTILRDDSVALQFDAVIEIPKDGDYLFHTISDDGSKLYINDQLIVSNDFNHDMERKSGLIHLSKGQHQLHLDYYNNTWGKGLAVFYEGPEIAYQALNSKLRKRNRQQEEPLILKADKAPEMLRGFVNYQDEKRTHAISVGDPQNVHYSLDLNNGALLKVWRGGFVDVTNMWKNRGYSQLAIPLALAAELSDGPILATLNQSTSPYPINPPVNFKLKGYEIDANERPIFNFQLGKASIQDQLLPSQDQLMLERTLSILANGEPNLHARIAHAEYIQQLDNGFYNIGGHYYLKMISTEAPLIRDNNDRQELLFPVSDSSTIKYAILW